MKASDLYFILATIVAAPHITKLSAGIIVGISIILMFIHWYIEGKEDK